MSKHLDSTNMSKKQIENTIRGMLYAVIFIPGLVISFWYWFGAGISLCGISGCSGGGFGVSYNPDSVRNALMWSGISAAVPALLIFFISKLKWWWIMIAIIMFILMPLIGGILIGAGFDGYPINRVR